VSEEERKIIGLDRRPFVPVAASEEPLEPEKPTVDQSVVDLLEEALQRARNGQVKGAILLLGIPSKHPDFLTHVGVLSTFAVDEHYQMFLGGLAEAKADILMLQNDILEEEFEYDD
jgi:hypothetical protein